jgi:DNA repair exonuclease SbcCD nuclease subunit
MSAPPNVPPRLRIAHLSDTHLGYRALYRSDPETGRNQRALDIERAYEAAIDDLLTRDVDLVIHSGDVFHHTRPSWSALRCFVRQTRRIEAAGVPCIVLGGNHDTPRLRTSGSVFSVLELALPEIDFVAEYDVRTFEFGTLGLTVFAVPHGALTNPEPPLVTPEAGTRNVLVTHGLVPGLIGRRNEPGEEELSGELLDAGFDYVALGHYHQWGAQGHNAWYAGSTERTGFGDEQTTPGYVLVELGAAGTPPTVEHVPLPVRTMKTLVPVAAEGREARELADIVLDRLRVLNDPEAMVRVELRDAPRPVRREAEAILRRESPELVWSLQVYSPADVLAGFGERSRDAAVTDPRALFEEFVTERTGTLYDAAFAAVFRERGGRALDEAIRAADLAAAAEDPAA